MTEHYSNSPLEMIRSWRYSRILVVMLVLVGSFVTVNVASAAKNSMLDPQTYQRKLQSEVETTNGVPRSGRDPSTQKQTSLAAAASRPIGSGQRVDKPAAKVHGTHRHVDPASVLPNTRKLGVLASGCLNSYGLPGEQCLPARTPSNPTGKKPFVCDSVRKLAPPRPGIANTKLTCSISNLLTSGVLRS